MAPWMIFAALGGGLMGITIAVLTVIGFLRVVASLDLIDDEGEW